MIKIVSAYLGMMDYIQAARNQPEWEWDNLWQQLVIDPYWEQWAAGQHNEARTREEMSHPPHALDGLEQAVYALAQSRVEELVGDAYEIIRQHLPYHDDEVAICIMAGDSNCQDVNGTCIGSSTLLTIPAMRGEWQPWVKYVLAHERHHSAWGYHYYYIRGGSQRNLLISLISEGAADTFAHYLCPGLYPAWVNALTLEEEASQWQIIQPLLDIPDVDGSLHRRFFFGDVETNTPPSTGYTIGFHILQEYWKRHPEEGVVEWTLKAPEDILIESGYPNYARLHW
jgi:uncharacterized protein YjaZ